MADIQYFNDELLIGLVRVVDDEQNIIWFDIRNGGSGNASGPDVEKFKVGDVIAIDVDRNIIQMAPREMWPQANSVAIVRLKDEQNTLI